MIFKHIFNRQIKAFPLTTKLIVTYTLLTIVPMGFLGFIAYYQYTQSIQEEVGEYVPRLVEQVNEKIENEIRKMEYFPDLIYQSGDVMTVLRDSAASSQSKKLRNEYIVKNYLTRTYLQNSSATILGAFLVSKNHVFASTTVPYKNFGFNDGTLPYADALSSLGGMQLILPNQANLSFEGSPSYFMLVKQITDFDNRKNLGTIYIAVDVSFFEEFLAELQQEKNVTMWIATKKGNIIYHTEQSKIGSVDPEIGQYPILNGSFRKNQDGEKSLVSVSESRELAWVLVHSMPIKNLTEKTDLVRNATIFVFMVVALVTTFISISFAWKVTRPLYELGSIMKKVEKGDLLVDIPIHSNDEVGILAKSFSSMLAEIRELIQRNYDIELRQRTAELYALQSQINPHFMYNTLETISMAVEDEEIDEVVTMLTLLGRMLRFSLSNKDSLVSIQNEVQHIEDYLRIQQFRFEDRLQFNIEKESSLLNYYVPKFVLQPIVENAIKYGLEKRKELSLFIHILEDRRYKENDEILLIVEDNGPGIDFEKLEQLNERLQSDPLAGRDSGFGVINVNARINMIFGEQYKLEITSKEEEGTKILMRIPKIDSYQAAILMKREELNKKNGEN
ncbi:sensor histidine kinase [Domibacillus indicus]|uniref:cache domain-containing sensor histidine kinase n=1 Tax=Domibacillus indicus TaxID=1437523 RepID=UPI00203EE6F0|nr:sensor histidine kinase [Domibacillus indicus]MCM3790708.1 sensor histidine kinase [Domibacillus indicus]